MFAIARAIGAFYDKIMALTLQVDRMSAEEKLRAIEELWVSLRKREDDIPVPQWHKDLLDARERESKQGRARFTDWSTAKREIADEIRQNRHS
ncbi:MAG TPA: addiction module protein [Opitutales bacterium]|nr:addiction module protein [Opitutales bacterium]